MNDDLQLQLIFVCSTRLLHLPLVTNLDSSVMQRKEFSHTTTLSISKNRVFTSRLRSSFHMRLMLGCVNVSTAMNSSNTM